MLTFWVAGRPVQQGSMKHVGGGRMVHSNAVGLRVWRDLVALSAVSACGDWKASKGDPVFLQVDFYLPRGKTVTRVLPTVTPDLDKLVRAVGDALTGSVIHDDAQIVSIVVSKHYASSVDNVGAKITVGQVAA